MSTRGERIKARRKFRVLNATHAYAVCDLCGREFLLDTDAPLGHLQRGGGRTRHHHSRETRWYCDSQGEWQAIRDHYEDSRCEECLRETP